MVRESGHLAFISLIVLLVEIVVLIFWKEYNRIRFAKKDRRSFRPDVIKDEIAYIMRTSPEMVDKMQNERIVVLENNIVPEELH